MPERFDIRIIHVPGDGSAPVPADTRVERHTAPQTPRNWNLTGHGDATPEPVKPRAAVPGPYGSSIAAPGGAPAAATAAKAPQGSTGMRPLGMAQDGTTAYGDPTNVQAIQEAWMGPEMKPPAQAPRSGAHADSRRRRRRLT